jgi:hypothetical protein
MTLRMNTSIAEWQAAGVVFEAEEAVAIAQQLITSLREAPPGDAAHAPFGPPSPDNVFLEADGSVVCCSCRVTPAVSEIGIFLEQLLAHGSPRVPGALRYTLARALMNVDVPPFDSVDELSRDLSRHERGSRADIVRRALARAHGSRALVVTPVVERRRHGRAVTTLRRELREADVRLYQQNAEKRLDPAVIDLVAVGPAISHGRRLSAASAACLAAGLSLIGAGELMHLRSKPTVIPQVALTPAPRAVSDEPRLPSPQAIASAETGRERGIITVREVVRTPNPLRPSRVAARSLVAKPIVRPPAASTRRPSTTSRRPSRGVLDRLRLGWLRHAFTSHSDL